MYFFDSFGIVEIYYNDGGFEVRKKSDFKLIKNYPTYYEARKFCLKLYVDTFIKRSPN